MILFICFFTLVNLVGQIIQKKQRRKEQRQIDQKFAKELDEIKKALNELSSSK